MSDDSRSFDVVVAGGGLSGLAVAEAILRRSPGLRVLCLESRERVGGCIQSVQRDGFVMEAGPAGFLDRTGALRRLVAALGIQDQLIESDNREAARWIRRNGRLHKLPSSIGSFLSSDLLSARGKLRMLLEPFQARRDGEETVSMFATRRLGKEASAILIDPIVSGIYAANASEVSLQAAMPQLAAMERDHRSLLTMLLRSTGRAQPLTSFRNGCEQLIQALHLRIVAAERGSIRCGAPIETVRSEGNGSGFRVQVGGSRPDIVRSRAFVSAAPARAASRFLASLDSRISWHLAQVGYASVAVVSMGFRREEVPSSLRGFGYLVPRSEATPVLGVQWSSSIFPRDRTQGDTSLLRIFIGGASHSTVAREPEPRLVEIAAAELRQTLGIRATPTACVTYRHFDAMPQYLLGHSRRVEEIERRSRSIPGFFVGGNGLRGLGMDSLVHDAEIQAAEVTSFLEQNTAPISISDFASLSQVGE